MRPSRGRPFGRRTRPYATFVLPRTARCSRACLRECLSCRLKVDRDLPPVPRPGTRPRFILEAARQHIGVPRAGDERRCPRPPSLTLPPRGHHRSPCACLRAPERPDSMPGGRRQRTHMEIEEIKLSEGVPRELWVYSDRWIVRPAQALGHQRDPWNIGWPPRRRRRLGDGHLGGHGAAGVPSRMRNAQFGHSSGCRS